MGEVMPTLDFEEIVIARRDQIETGRPSRGTACIRSCKNKIAVCVQGTVSSLLLLEGQGQGMKNSER